MTWLFAPGLAALALLTAWCVARLRREYRTREVLTLTTVAAVWTLYVLHFCLFVAAAVWAVWPLPFPRWPAMVAGSALVLLGLAMYEAAAVAFQSLKRMSGLDASRLVTSGIYRWSRNPQNVGWTLVLLGASLASASGMALLLTVLFWIGFRAYLPLEEQLLQRLYGDAYGAYRARTARYFGRPSR